MKFRGLTLGLSAMLLSVSASAAPMPNSIVVKDKAIVNGILKLTPFTLQMAK